MHWLEVAGKGRIVARLCLLLALGPGVAFASTNNLVVNGSFESGAAGWTLFGLGAGVQYSLTNLAAHGNQALRATNRTLLTHHVAQDIAANLTAEGNGVPVGIGFAVYVTAPVSVRCLLQITDDGGTRHLILAEKMITAETNTWVDVRGGRSLTWQGTVSNALVRFEIGQIVEKFYPATILDNIRVIRDSDQDGLTDDVDPAPSNADMNSNQIPDGWESRYGLAPESTDADFDGFTNLQEYWAATDPTNSLSLPAQPANTNATPEARALLKYLALLPSQPTNRVLIGQVVTTTASDYTNQFIALAAQTGKWPAMLGVVYDMINGPINHPVITPHATNYWNAGGLVHIQWNPDNPWTGGFSGDTNGIDFATLFTPGTTAHSNYLASLDEVATGLRQLGDAGLTVLFRPLNECNGGSNWFQRRARAEYIPLYRWTFDYLAKTQALNHVLWVFDTLNNPHTSIPVTYYYPGDDVVDVFGVNVYDDDWVLPFDLDRLSRDYPKPLGIPEGGSETIFNGTFSNLTYIAGITNGFPRLSYFNIYNSFTTGGGAITKKYALVDNIDAAGLFNHPWIVTLDELAWRANLGPFGAWQLQQFTTNANNTSLAGPLADPDADGTLNLAEYGLGTDPHSTTPPGITPTATGLNFPRNLAATDLTLAVEATSDLTANDWTPIAVKAGAAAWVINPGLALTDPGTGNVGISEPGNFPARFWRLKITGP
ncbi:MAG: hypothetical protein PCFJNLEI_03940 [Verrucomicrobiae bacterium]|nr:hypothetical protein [Verrucomicrobiae bacterium]